MRYLFKKGKKKEELMREITESHIETLQYQIDTLKNHENVGEDSTGVNILKAQKIILTQLLNDFDRL